MKSENGRLILLMLAITESVALVWFSVLPSIEVVPAAGLLRPGDLEHFAAYSVYGFLWAGVFGYTARSSKGRNRMMIAGFIFPFAIASAMGAFCEALQLFVPTRTADVLDWLIDSLGATFGIAVASKMKSLF
jgi:VanZ family protein